MNVEGGTAYWELILGWALDVTKAFADFGRWLTTPLELVWNGQVIYSGQAPYILFGVGLGGMLVVLMALKLKTLIF